MLPFLLHGAYNLAVSTMITHQAGGVFGVDINGIVAYVDNRLDTILNRKG